MSFEASATTCQENKAHESLHFAPSKLFFLIFISAASSDRGSQTRNMTKAIVFFSRWDKTLINKRDNFTLICEIYWS